MVPDCSASFFLFKSSYSYAKMHLAHPTETRCRRSSEHFTDVLNTDFGGI